MNKLNLDGLNKKVFLALLLPIGVVFSDVVPLPIGTLTNGFPMPGIAAAPNTFAWAITNNVMASPDNFFHGTGW